MKKPSWFRLWDILAFAVPIIGISAVTIYAMILGVEGAHAKQGLVLCWVVVATFIAIWARISWARKKALEEFTWYPTYGFMVHGNGYILPPEGIFDGTVFKTVQLWSKFHPNAEAIVKEEINWVFFHKDLNENDKNPAHMKVNGFTFALSHTMAVDFDNPIDALEKTAFEHELGHVIHGFATNNWDMAEHHEFMKKNGLR